MLKRGYAQHRADIRSVLSELSLPLPHYEDLEWRLDVAVSGRCAHQHTPVQPFYILKLTTTNPAEQQGQQQQILQADPVTLANMCAQLESAIAQLKASSSRRVMRNIK